MTNHTKNTAQCPYLKEVCGVDICMLNIIPCERVSLELCGCVKENEDEQGNITESKRHSI